MFETLTFERLKPGTLLLAAALAVMPAAACAGDQQRLGDEAGDRHPGGETVVLELFTSQGCSSCPSADAFLGELAAERDDVVALSFHVDYWDYIGWEDPFATARMTARQKAYSKALGIAYVYTPQLVIDGVRHVTGSDRRAVKQAIAVSRSRQATRAPVTLRESAPGRLTVEIGAAEGYRGAAAVLLVSVDRRHTTTVDAGENRGRTLVNHHVVRSYRPIGSWTGKAMTLELEPDALGSVGDGRAILVQTREGRGRIMGADMVWLDEADG